MTVWRFGMHSSSAGGLAALARDSVALAAAIRQLLADDNLRDELRKQARQIVEGEYVVSSYAERHIRLYEGVIERHCRGNRR